MTLQLGTLDAGETGLSTVMLLGGVAGKEEEGEDERKYGSWYSLNRIRLGL